MVPAVVEWWRLCLSRELSARGDFRGGRSYLGAGPLHFHVSPNSNLSWRLNVKENSKLSNRRKNILRAACLSLGVLLIALALPLASRAQDTGYISGTVTDKSGAAIVGASVTITGAGGNLTRNTTTNSDGAYTVAGLLGGTYDVVLTAAGFQKFTPQKVVLDVARKFPPT